MLKFIGIGAQKSGTTWLYTMLSHHPNVAFPLGKEAHFWDQKFTGNNANNYLTSFSSDTLHEGDITPAYGHLSLDAIKTVHSHSPNVQLIYIIRNPIDRAWSSALMALQRAEMEIHEASDQWFIDHFNSQGSLSRGDYKKCIENWLKFYSKEQLLLLKYEEIIEEPKTLLKKCCDHLHIPYFSDELITNIKIHDRIFYNKSHPLPLSLRKVLHDIYASKIYFLENYLEEDLSVWID